MPTRNNPFQHISTELTRELTHSKRRAMKTDTIPFGFESVPLREARTRLQSMTRADLEQLSDSQYQDLVRTMGTEAIVEILNRSQSPFNSART